MDNRNIRRFERANRVQAFGRDNTADITPGSKAAGFFLALDPIVLELTDARVGQLRGVVGKPVLIDNLSLDFKDVARTARAIKLDEPGFDDSLFRHPGTSVETTVTTHADSLLKLLEDAATDTPAQLAGKAALRAKFIAYEIAADFVEDLRRDRDATATPANTATTSKASKAPPPSRLSSATPRTSSPASTPPSKTNTAATPTSSPPGKAPPASSAPRRKRRPPSPRPRFDRPIHILVGHLQFMSKQSIAVWNKNN